MPSSIKHHRYSNDDIVLYVGTSVITDKRDFSPRIGNLYVIKIEATWALGEKEFSVLFIHQIKLNGGILEIQTMLNEVSGLFLLLGVNSTLGVFSLKKAEEE